jgi:pyruvate/2-oxoglutarate dehydrogenase complex dihydrolipoamide acyltransferase (E2) component
MITEVTLKQLAESMEEGEISKWLKQEGDQVQEGDVLVEVASDKANVEVEAPTTGYLRKIVVPEGTTVPVSATVAFIADSRDEELPAES